MNANEVVKGLADNGSFDGTFEAQGARSGEKTDFTTGKLWEEVQGNAQKLCKYLGWKFSLREHDGEDCYQRIIEAFLEMAQNYDSSKLPPEVFIKTMMKLICKREKKYLAREANRFKRLKENFHNIEHLRDCDYEDTPKLVDFDDEIIGMDVRLVMEKLDGEQKQLCKWLAEGWNESEIASFLGVHRGTINRKISRFKDIFGKIEKSRKSAQQTDPSS